MSRILYNNVDPFTGLAPTPLFSRTASMIRYGSRWGQRHDIVLQGKLTGKCITYEDFVARQQQLLSGFSKDFQTLEIHDETGVVESFPLVRINSIDFEDSTYSVGYVPFAISLEAYPENYFSGAFGVLEPREEVKFQEDDDGSIMVSHTTSAIGFCTSSTNTNDALQNARDWVAARTGWNSQILPNFIQGVNNGLCLQTIGENYDRLNARYEVTETYRGDQFGNASQGLLRYSTDFSSGIERGVAEIEVKGELQGCRYQDLSSLRSRYASFNAFNEAMNQFQRITNRTDLNSLPISKGVSEDVNNRLISFNYVYNDDMRPRVGIAYSIDFSYDFEADIITASIAATVSSKAAYSSTKWQEVLDVANAVNLYSLIVPAYNTYVSQVAPHLGGVPLRPMPQSQSFSQNEYASTVTLSASYTNAPLAPAGLDEFNASISIEPAIRKYAAAPILDGMGSYYIFDLGFKSRGAISINAQGLGSDASSPLQTLAILKTQVQNIAADHLSGPRMIIDSQSYQTGNASFGKASSVSATFSAESPEFTL